MGRGKKYKIAQGKVDRARKYSFDEALTLVKEIAYAKFDESIEVGVKINIKKSHSVRDILVLPHQFAEEKRVLVFAKGDKAVEAEEAGARYVGGEELVEKIKAGWLDFDVCVATPDMMRDVGKLGPILGRRGLMPNPKTRTVTADIKGAITELKQGRREFRADKTGVVHMVVGKVSMQNDQIKENVAVFMDELKKKRPSDVKGDFIKSASLATSMGPGVGLEVQD